MQAYLCEFIGTAMLVLLGDGVCMNVSLNKSGFKGSSTTLIAIGWGLAVMVPAFMFGYSGASFNPVLTIALAVVGNFDWALVPGYIVAQMLGGFVGAAVLSLVYKDHLDATEKEGGSTLGVYACGPSIPNTPMNVLQEAVATFVLVFAILAIPSGYALPNFAVFGIIMVCGMSFGGLTGYAMNPARDLSPRIAHAIFRKNDKNNNWGYAWVTVVGPLCGALVAGLLWKVVPFFHM